MELDLCSELQMAGILASHPDGTATKQILAVAKEEKKREGSFPLAHDYGDGQKKWGGGT